MLPDLDEYKKENMPKEEGKNLETFWPIVGFMDTEFHRSMLELSKPTPQNTWILLPTTLLPPIVEERLQEYMDELMEQYMHVLKKINRFLF